jgi:hypothetical protein
MGHIELPAVSTRWRSTWKVSRLPILPICLKYTGPKSPFGCNIGGEKEWTEFSKDIDLGVPLPSPKANVKDFQIFSTAAPWHMDLLPASGQALWLRGSSKKNSPSPIIPPMFRAFCMDLGSPYSVRRNFWHKLTTSHNLAGFVINTPILKKSQGRKGGAPLRRRSELSTRSHPLQNMVTSRFAAGNTINRTTQHTQDLWHHRTVLCSISLPISNSLQCAHVLDLSRTDRTFLFPQKDIFDSGQRSLSQRSRCVAMVCCTSQIYRSIQSSSIFSRIQRARENMAFHPLTWHPQSIFFNPQRALFHVKFDVSEHSDEAIAGYGILASLSINIMSLYLCNAI